VVAAQRARDKAELDAAPEHHTSPQRAAELRQIAVDNHDHEDRVTAALRTGWTSAEELTRHCDTMDAHARLAALRAAGQPLVDRWVRTFTATGNERRVKVYRLPWDNTP
jgi:hypothetical protein